MRKLVLVLVMVLTLGVGALGVPSSVVPDAASSVVASLTGPQTAEAHRVGQFSVTNYYWSYSCNKKTLWAEEYFFYANGAYTGHMHYWPIRSEWYPLC